MSAQQKENLINNSLAHETSLGHILKLSWPMIISTISFTIMQFVDTKMVSKLGTNELAAILPAGIMSFIPSCLMLGIVKCVNTFVSQCYGRGDRKSCSGYCWQVFYMGTLFSLLMLIILWPCARTIFTTMRQPAEIINSEVTYFRIMLYCQFLLIFIWGCNEFFIGIHRPMLVMYGSVIQQIINVFANYTLIFGKFGFPAMGIAGAGWGTFIGLSFGAIFRLIFFLGGNVNSQYYSRTNLKVDLSKMWDFVRVGFPAGLGFMINIGAWTLILFGLVGWFGKEPLAATVAIWTCMRFAFMPIIGVGSALTAAVGKSIGAGFKDNAIKQTNHCVRIAFLYMSFIGLFFFLFREPLMRFWAEGDREVINSGVQLMIFAALFQLFDGILIIYHDALRGAGDTIFLAIVEIFGATVILGGGGFLLVYFFPQLGEKGPWIAGVFKILFGAVANMWRFKTNKWQKIDLFRLQKAEIPSEISSQIEQV